jgi:8-oxo-dGTP pyrophosphatase MutT (NUDIX family)
MTSPATINVLRVVAYAVVCHQHLLLVRKRNTTKFMFPGGKLDPGETRLEAVIREVREEINCQVELPTVQFLGKFVTTAANEANTRLIAYVYSGQLIGSPVATNEIEEVFWLPGRERPDQLSLAPLVSDCVLPRLYELQKL